MPLDLSIKSSLPTKGVYIFLEEKINNTFISRKYYGLLNIYIVEQE